jgi:hypothetical protein
VLLAHPAVLKDLIEQYEMLQDSRARNDTPDTARRIDDVSYTLCVLNGTRDLEAALAAARERVAAAAHSGLQREDPQISA